MNNRITLTEPRRKTLHTYSKHTHAYENRDIEGERVNVIAQLHNFFMHQMHRSYASYNSNNAHEIQKYMMT